MIRETLPHGCVTACGLVGGVKLQTTVYPFILRGVTLAGMQRLAVSPAAAARNLAFAGRSLGLAELPTLVETVGLADLAPQIDRMLRGDVRGRVLVRVGGDSEGTPVRE